MNRLVIAMIAVLAACGDPETKDTPEIAAAKLDCHKLFVHVVSISPQAAGQDAEKIVADLPVEETEQCRVSEPEVRACIEAATDVAGVRACVPADPVLGCMATAANIPSVRAACWSGVATDKGHPKAADKLSEAKLACAARAAGAVPKQMDVAEKCLADPHAADGIKASDK